MQTTQLAHGKITNANTLTIELIEPPGMPAAILLRWPQKPSITTPDAYSNMAAGRCKISQRQYRTSGPSSPEAAMRSPSRKV
jgi:hypothetical protein